MIAQLSKKFNIPTNKLKVRNVSFFHLERNKKRAGTHLLHVTARILVFLHYDR